MHHKGCTAFGVPNSCGDTARAFGAKSWQQLLEKAISTPWRLRTLVVLTWRIWLFLFCLVSPVFSRADPDLIRGMWDVAQDVADVWGSPAVDLDRALTKAWWEGLMGPRRPTCTSYQLNVSKRSGTVWIPIERATRNEETPCIMRMLYAILHNICI